MAADRLTRGCLMAGRRAYGVGARQAKDSGMRMAWGTDFLNPGSGPVAGQDRAAFGALPCRLTARRPETLDIAGQRQPTPRPNGHSMSPDGTVTHTYWLGPEGTIRTSRQWAGPHLGSITVERPNR